MNLTSHPPCQHYFRWKEMIPLSSSPSQHIRYGISIKHQLSAHCGDSHRQKRGAMRGRPFQTPLGATTHLIFAHHINVSSLKCLNEWSFYNSNKLLVKARAYSAMQTMTTIWIYMLEHGIIYLQNYLKKGMYICICICALDALNLCTETFQ